MGDVANQAVPLTRAKVYRNVERKMEWLGLEPFDALLLGAVMWLLMVMNNGAAGWNVVALMLAYAGLRLAKRGRPEGHTAAVVRFYAVRRPAYSAASPDREKAAHWFGGFRRAANNGLGSWGAAGPTRKGKES